MIRLIRSWVTFSNSVDISTRKKQILKTMGIPLWSAHRQIPGEKKNSFSATDESFFHEHQDTDIIHSDNDSCWDQLKQQVSSCTACDLHKTRTNTVFGVGTQQAGLMIIGEAPGHDEDLQAEPFVGKAGQLLNQMLFALGFLRQDVFIANILKCRPPNNRDPLPHEVEACSRFLLEQISIVNPKVILSVGGVSAKNLLHSDERIGKLRGQVLKHADTSTPLVATYHPAYLLRSPTEKRKVWNDLLLVKKLLNEVT